MNGQNVAIAGGATGYLAQLIYFFSHWPLQPMDTNTSTAAAALLCMAAGYVLHLASRAKPDPLPLPEVKP